METHSTVLAWKIRWTEEPGGYSPRGRKELDVTGDESKVQCYKEKYCIATWNVRSMNQGKLIVVKQR